MSLGACKSGATNSISPLPSRRTSERSQPQQPQQPQRQKLPRRKYELTSGVASLYFLATAFACAPLFLQPAHMPNKTN